MARAKKQPALEIAPAYILLDRSSSMSSRWTEAIGGINAFVATLTKDKATKDTPITVATFDLYNGFQFDVIRRAEKASEWRAITNEDATPRGSTPLFDGICRMVALAEDEKPKLATIITMTDGAENASREANKETAKAAMGRAQERGWQVMHLGVDFDAFAQARSYGVGMGQTINTSSANTRMVMRNMASVHGQYTASAGAHIHSFTEEERAAALDNAQKALVQAEAALDKAMAAKLGKKS